MSGDLDEPTLPLQVSGPPPTPTRPLAPSAVGTAVPVPVSPPGPLPGSVAPLGVPVIAGGYQTVRHLRPRVGAVHLTIAWIAAIVTVAYMLPWAVAATRQKSNALAIGLLNLLAGWTMIGWIAALVLACLAEPATYAQVVQVRVVGGPPLPGWSPDGTGRQRYWNGSAWV